MTTCDVAIVGYGPTGATLANLLGQAGLSVAVIEKDLAPYDRPRAIGIDHESLRTLQSCGMAEALRGHIQPFRGTRYLGLDGELIKRLVPVPPPYLLGWPPNATFVQPELEAMLRHGAESRSGVHVLTGHRMLELHDEGEMMRLAVEEVASGTRREVMARYVVGCDGASSMVRKFIGGPTEDLDFDEWWVVVDALLLDESAVPAIGCHYCWPSRPVSYVMGPRNLRRWELKVLPGEDPAMFHDRGRILEALAPHVPAAAIEIWRTAVYRFHAIVAQDWSRGQAFIAGDAAHQMPPFLGQGMNAGIRDVANLAWKLQAVLRDGAPASLLETYEQERKPHVRTITARAKSIGLILGELDHDAALRRDAALRQEMASGAAIEIRQGYIPPLTCGVLADAPGAGTLSVQPLVRTQSGEERWLDDLVGPHFLIAAAEPEVLDWLDDPAQAAWAAIGGRVILVRPAGSTPAAAAGSLDVAELGTVLADWMRGLGCPAVIVRPDRYVFGTAGTPQALRRLVDRVVHHLRGGTLPAALSHADLQPEKATT